MEKVLRKSDMKDIGKKINFESAYVVISKYKKLGDESPYKTILNYLNRKSSSIKVYTYWFSQLRDCIPLLDKSTEKIIIDTLNSPWQFENEDVNNLVHSFVVSLLTGHNYFVHPILECLFQKLVPDMSEADVEELRINPFKFSGSTLDANYNIIKLINSIYIHVPLCHDALLKTIKKSYPYIKKHVHTHVVFMYNMFVLISFIPNMRRQIFEILLLNIIKLDLHSPRIELDEESDSESLAGSEDMFNMEVDSEDENNTSVLAPLTSHPIGHCLDMLLTLFFRYIHLISHGGSDLRQLLGNSSAQFVVKGCRAGSAAICSEVDKENSSSKNTVGCECRGSKHDLKALKSLYLDVKFNFEKIILPTHASSHAQFIVFFILSLRPSLVSDFLDFLKAIFESPSSGGAKEDRKSATAYLGSLLSRGKFIKFSHVHYCLELLNNWCRNYLASEFVQANKYEDFYMHHRFYYACQTLFYTFTFNFKEYTESKARLKLAQSFHLDELVLSPLNPLRYCSSAIAMNFASITRHFQLAYCFGIIESNSRAFIPYSSQDCFTGDQHVRGLEMFFPFDPYLLKRSYSFIHEHYMQFEGLPDDIQDSPISVGGVKDNTFPLDSSMKSDFDNSLLWNSPPKSLDMSPGFQSFH